MSPRFADGPWISVTNEMVIPSKKFAIELMADLKRPERRATLLHGIRGIESNEALLTRAKIGECVAAFTLGYGIADVNFRVGKSDGGIDILTLDRDKIGVKTSDGPSRFLMHTVKDKDDLEGAIKVDKMILVQLEPHNRRGRCRGYLTKAQFIGMHKNATADYPSKRDPTNPYKHIAMLDLDTPFVEVDRLESIFDLIAAHKTQYFDKVAE